MKLETRLLLGSAVGIATMCIVAVLAFVMLRSMESSVLTVTEEYTELQIIDDAVKQLAGVRTAITDERYDDAVASLEGVRAAVDSYVGTQDEHGGAEPEHHLEEAAAGERTRARILALQGAMRAKDGGQGPEGVEGMLANVEAIQAELTAQTTLADHVVGHSLLQAHRQLSVATVLLIGTCACGTLLLLVLAYAQHRSIVSPIILLRDRMRAAIEQKAPGSLDHPDDVLRELGSSFDELVRELEELYGSLEQRIRSKSQELVQSERLASVGYLAAGIAHEINNPLSAILGHTELTLRDVASSNGDAPPEACASLQVVRDETMRCKSIVEKLLALVRKSDAPCETVDLGEAIKGVTATIEGLKQFRRRTIHVEVPEDECLAVFAREVEVKQILLNLIVNALEATAPGDGQVVIQATREGGTVCIRVRDNGLGLTEAERVQVFEPFYTNRGRGNQPGVGLGLSIVHAIVRDHRGTIEAQSDGLERGSTFVVRLPALAVEEEADA